MRAVMRRLFMPQRRGASRFGSWPMEDGRSGDREAAPVRIRDILSVLNYMGTHDTSQEAKKGKLMDSGRFRRKPRKALRGR